MGLLLAGCTNSVRPEYLTSTQTFLLVDSQKSPTGYYIVYELESRPSLSGAESVDQLKAKHQPLLVKTLGDFDRQYELGKVFVLLVRKVTNKESRQVTYTYRSTELELTQPKMSLLNNGLKI